MSAVLDRPTNVAKMNGVFFKIENGVVKSSIYKKKGFAPITCPTMEQVAKINLNFGTNYKTTDFRGY